MMMMMIFLWLQEMRDQDRSMTEYTDVDDGRTQNENHNIGLQNIIDLRDKVKDCLSILEVLV